MTGAFCMTFHSRMAASFLAYAARQVPRYTSYPPASQFSTAVDATDAEAWLGEIEPGTPLSIYLHVPFCRQMCLYCGCHTRIVRRTAPVEAYAELLLSEIGLVADRLPGRLPVHRIHWGGGTPSLLPAKAFARLVDALAQRFDLSPLYEHAIELDPRTVTPEVARSLATCGMNRASFGVQDFNPHVQKAIGRVQPPDIVSAACDHLRAVGIDHISFDLMYGLPHQTTADAVRTVEAAMELGPRRIALFGYAHVPWFKSHQRLIDEASLPGARERLAQASAAAAAIVSRGFVAIGFDHFARPSDPLALALAEGRLHRNFQGYTDDNAPVLLGLGVSSIGSTPRGFLQNAPDMGAYMRAIERGSLATVRGLAITEEDAVRAAIIERLMCDMRVDVAAVCRDHLWDPFYLGPAFEEIEPMVRDGLARVEGHRITVTEAGRPFVRLIAAAFDAYLPHTAARHSRAV
jgi:oxygen-independent coproporphyrinogen-3 oxidase